MKELVKEITIHVQLSHPNVINLRGVVLAESEIRLVLPYMPNGSLAKHLATITWPKSLEIMKQIAWGMEYLHTKVCLACSLHLTFLCSHLFILTGYST